MYYKTFFYIYISSSEIEFLCISGIVIKQLLEYKLLDYFQFINFPIAGYGMIL